MAPHLRVLAGTSPDTMVPISSLVNTGKSYTLTSPLFEGNISAHIKGFTDERGRVRESEYFSREDKAGITWSIQVQGRFLEPHSADDILFGNTFDRPLKLPWGTSAVLKFMHYIDPTLEHDLTSSTKPWALSPLIATMPNFAHTRVAPDASLEDLPPFPPPHLITDDTRYLQYALVDMDDSGRPIPTITTSSPPHRRSSSSSQSSLSPGHSPEQPVSMPNRPPSSLSSYSAGSTGSGSSASFISSKSSSSARSSVSKISGTGSLRIKQAMRKVHLRKPHIGRDSNSTSHSEDDSPDKASRRSRRARRDRERELTRLDTSSAAQRRAHFASKAKRSDVWFGPSDVITTDFCYGFINFAPSLALQLPGGLSFDLMKYWDGQPVRFVCCERVKEGASEPWGRIFWCVAIEMVDDDDD
ncbi:DUF1769-domain-containing protein [Pholiota conissans]|uniref:DUF1769-domain-containing protein n=1 Tax=Pholiota conissans TaxID=109636 RepID=A0A9P5YV63_9AGAR|nr:DUF1769-domain-containing protein [Pholiota conissans]